MGGVNQTTFPRIHREWAGSGAPRAAGSSPRPSSPTTGRLPLEGNYMPQHASQREESFRSSTRDVWMHFLSPTSKFVEVGREAAVSDGSGRSCEDYRGGSSGPRGGEGAGPGRRRNLEKKTATSCAAVTEANKMAVPKGRLWLRAQLGISPLLLLAMALAGGSGTASAEAFDSVLGDTASCHRACQLTYPLHTYPKVGPVRTGLQPFPGSPSFRSPAPLSFLGA